jgi:hypothetical protein
MTENLQSFVLDDEQHLDLIKLVNIERWTEFSHAKERSRGLVIVAGETLRSPWIKAPEEPCLSISYLRGLPKISTDGLTLNISIEFNDENKIHDLLTCFLNNEMPNAGLSNLESTLPINPGTVFRLVITVGAGPQGKPEGDWLGLTLLSIGDSCGQALRRAKNNLKWRLKNEIEHFQAVYCSDFYKDRQIDRRSTDNGLIRKLPTGISKLDFPVDLLSQHLKNINPAPEENVYSFATRLLGSLLPITPPNYAERLQKIHARQPDRPVRMLSICAGEAAIEGSILSIANVPVSLCLLDINSSLLNKAAIRIPDCAVVDRVLGDANQLSGQLGLFDVINITSGLHHLVDLESVLGGIADSLDVGGEFWLIGEQVGRNGNRLFPDARNECNKIFSNWPSSRRKNSSTNVIDDFMPDLDYSSACFEGIRSQEILQLLDRYFLGEDVYLRNCFLWRLFNAAYSANFDLGIDEDVTMVRKAVTAELLHWAHGGVGTELFGIYRGKQAEILSKLRLT